MRPLGSNKGSIRGTVAGGMTADERTARPSTSASTAPHRCLMRRLRSLPAWTRTPPRSGIAGSPTSTAVCLEAGREGDPLLARAKVGQV